MSKKVLRIAAPIALSVLAPGLGTAIGGALGAGTGLGASVLGNALIGGATGAIGGGGLKGALLGAASGGLGSAIGGSGILGTAAGTPLKNALGPTQGSGILGAVTRGTSAITGPLSSITGGGGSSFGNVSNLVGAASNLNTANQSDKALKQQLAAQQKGIAALDPYAQTGQSANSQLAKLLGIDPNADASTIQDALRNTPGYQFQLDQGTQALDRSAAARGGLFSGRAAKELQQFGQGLGDQTYQSAIANLRPSVGTGLTAASGQAGIYDNVGDLQANNTMNKANLMNDTLSGFFGQGNQEEMVADPRTGKKVPRSQLGQ